MVLNKVTEAEQRNGRMDKKNSLDEKSQQHVDYEDPLSTMLAIFDKKTRNLEKKRYKALQLKTLIDEGKQLNQDQKASAFALGEIEANIELIKEFIVSTSALRAEFIKIRSTRSSSSANQASEQSINQNSVKVDAVKYYMELQNSLKKVVEHETELKKLKPADNFLKSEEVDKLLGLWKLIKPSDNADSSAKVKKIIQTVMLLLNKDQRVVNVELGLTFAQFHTLIHKIVSSVNALQPSTVVQKVEKTEAKVEEVISQPPIQIPAKPLKDEVKKEELDGNEEWFEIPTSSHNSSKRKENSKPHADRSSAQNFHKKSNIRAVESQNKTDEVKNSSRPGKVQIVITDIPPSTTQKPFRKDQFRSRNYSNSNKGFSGKAREQPSATVSTS